MLLWFGRVVGAEVGTLSNLRRSTKPVGLLVETGASG